MKFKAKVLKIEEVTKTTYKGAGKDAVPTTVVEGCKLVFNNNLGLQLDSKPDFKEGDEIEFSLNKV